MCMHSGHFCLKEVLNMVRQEDIEYMRRAMELAERGVGFTNPNPMVGAVIVKGGRMAREMRRMACGEERFQELYVSRGGCHDVRDVGTLLPLWKDPALHGGHY